MAYKIASTTSPSRSRKNLFSFDITVRAGFDDSFYPSGNLFRVRSVITPDGNHSLSIATHSGISFAATFQNFLGISDGRTPFHSLNSKVAIKSKLQLQQIRFVDDENIPFIRFLQKSDGVHMGFVIKNTPIVDGSILIIKKGGGIYVPSKLNNILPYRTAMYISGLTTTEIVIRATTETEEPKQRRQENPDFVIPEDIGEALDSLTVNPIYRVPVDNQYRVVNPHQRISYRDISEEEDS